MTCITIASWMLAVVGVVMIIPSSYYINYKFILSYNNNAFLVTLSIIGVSIGILMFVIGILPYIPEITLPCIQIIP